MIVVKRQLEISVIILNKSGGLAAFEGPCEIGHSNNRLDSLRTHKIMIVVAGIGLLGLCWKLEVESLGVS
jgi:hypothetical protein